jgi:hypothetical protein
VNFRRRLSGGRKPARPLELVLGERNQKVLGRYVISSSQSSIGPSNAAATRLSIASASFWFR